ncbi:hypothetical protein KW796_01105 [Candidatus Parcubacteria bacterium]|nr:hypothetical protein [Candidatus Parcubacteria bacterium]
MTATQLAHMGTNEVPNATGVAVRALQRCRTATRRNIVPDAFMYELWLI